MLCFVAVKAYGFNVGNEAFLSKCQHFLRGIGYLKKQEGVELEIVVVDNASTQAERDKTAHICYETGCTFIQNTVNRGYNAGNNVGLRYAAEHGFPYAMVINPDVQLLKSDIVKIMVEKSEEDTDIVALGTDVISPEGF